MLGKPIDDNMGKLLDMLAKLHEPIGKREITYASWMSRS
jgi:hypothetical protein